ncbi:MAG: SUMF1/EgtB/PvdO family nonheme iron enzyme [Cyanobacteria bacterium P01_H01_bin.105]
MVRIFLAYANEDEKAVTDLYNRLKERGFQPWMDKEDLVPGQNWRSEIHKAIKNSDIFLACLSQISVTKKGYVQKEFRLALNHYAEMPLGAAYLIPVRLNDCDIPELRQEEYGVNLIDIHWVNLFESDGFEKLVKAINHHFPSNPGQPSALQTPIPNKELPKETKQAEEKVVILQEGPKYDLRGAQFAGGFAETVLGNQGGGTINNEPSEPSTPESPRPTIETKAIDLGSGVTLELVHIPSGNFLMGAHEREMPSLNNERPQHEVTVPEFWMGKYPITQAQYKAVTNQNPSHFKGDDLPVDQVSWYDAVEFCKQLSKKTGKHYRLPSEAEWEYACRAGTTTRYFFGDKLTGEQANFKGSKTTPAEKYPANAFGLYDMHGNVWEWCQDYWHGNYDGAPTNGSVWIKDGDDEYRAMRGGSWTSNLVLCRSARRYDYLPDSHYNFMGFRVVSAPLGSLP